MSWTVVLTGSARRDIRRLDPPVAARILDALDRLATTGQGDTQRLLRHILPRFAELRERLLAP